MATLQTLEAFEAYAAELFPLVGAEVLEQALQRLLKGNGHKALISLESLDGPAAVRWCLDGLRQPQPWQPVARVTVLEALSVDDDIRLLLDEAPALLAFAPEPVAKRFGQVLVSLLSEEEAGSWLKSLGQCAIESRQFQTASEGTSLDGTEALRAYARGTAAVLRQFPREAYCSDAWSIARQAMLGDAGDRQICVQQLLPDLVAVSAREVAAVEISNMVELLGTGQTAAAVREALNLATSFSELLLDFWKLPSLQGDHNTVGVRLISDALRLGQKDCGSLRKQARFLLESAVQKSLVAADAEQCFQSTAGQSLASTSSAWRLYWELFDTLEDYSSHLIKSSWQALSSRLAQYLATLPKGSELPPAVLSPFWFEVFLLRALDHDNDTVQKFVLGQLMCLDEAACLSESFILTEVLPRFGHGIDSLYLRTDVERTFERQAVRFFSNFLRGGKAARLLEALFAVKAVHFTPVRLVLEALASSESGDLEPAQALDLAQRFFSSEMLLRMPNSVRQMLASLFLRVLVRLCVTSRDCPESGSLVAKVATTLAVIPDALLAPLQSLLGSLVQSWLQLDADASAACAGMFLKGLLSAEDQTKPMEACQQTLGLVRLLWALQGEALFLRLVCPVLAEAVRDMHRRSYLPRRVAVCALLLAAYGAQMLKQDSDIMDSNCLEEILSYVENQAMLAMGQGRPEAVVQEAPWVWLYALVLERWHPRRASQVLPKALEKLRREEPREPAETLGLVAAASLLGAVAHMAEEKSAAFLALLRFQAPGKPSGVVDSRFGIGVKEDLGQWQRSRLEEYEDLQRIQHEGLGRVQEWRDASSVVLVAKWRALAQIVRCKDFEAQDLGPEVVAEVLEELDSLQAPHVAYWAVVARRLYPLYFAEADGGSKGEKQDMLERLCRSIRGFISQSVGDGARAAME
ncbi:unnamed protein product [Effrenium voratum]|nr:unnamed protein product [Effrenium voratum]